MSEKLKGGICKFGFGYNAKMKGYTTLMLDIPKLSAMAQCKMQIEKCKIVLQSSF